VGAPDVGIQRWAESKLDLVMADDYDLGEGDSVSRTDGIVRIKVHRDRDGEISEDGNDEEYCRFGISISLA